jgi:hypothetical protein
LAVYVPALLAGAAVTLYLEFLDPRTSHGIAHIRGAVLASAAAYFLSSILMFLTRAFRAPDLSPAAIFFPSLGSVTAVLAALYIWVFVIYVRDLFRSRELFESHLRRYRGEELRRVMLEDSALMTAAESRGASAGRYYGVQAGLAFLLSLLCDFLGAPFSPFRRIISILIPANAALVFFLFGLFRQEQFFAGEGIAVPGPERGKRIGAGTAFCAAAALLAALCASNNNILPISIITAFFAWLARLLSRPAGITKAPVEFAPPSPPLDHPQAMPPFLDIEPSEPWPLWDYLPYIALAAAVAAFLWFMIKPLFSLNRRQGTDPLLFRLARLFLGGFSGLRGALKHFLAALRSGSGIRLRIPAEKIQDMTEELMGAWTKARKRELRQSLSLFARLILWGERRRAWKPSMGPGEYCALLASSLTESAHEKDPKIEHEEDHEGGSLPPGPSPPAAPPERSGGTVLASPPPRGKGPGKGAGEDPQGGTDPAAPPRRPRNPGDETPPRPPAGEQSAAMILRCGAIFEEALYGPRLPDRETQREFRRLVEEITGKDS